MNRIRFLLAIIASTLALVGGTAHSTVIYDGTTLTQNQSVAEGSVYITEAALFAGDGTSQFELSLNLLMNNVSLTSIDLVSNVDPLLNRHFTNPIGTFSFGPIGVGYYDLIFAGVAGVGGGTIHFTETANVIAGYVAPHGSFGGGNTGGSVPEPASLALVLLCLAAVSVFRRTSA